MKVMTKRYKKIEKQAHREAGGKRDGRRTWEGGLRRDSGSSRRANFRKELGRLP